MDHKIVVAVTIKSLIACKGRFSCLQSSAFATCNNLLLELSVLVEVCWFSGVMLKFNGLVVQGLMPAPTKADPIPTHMD
ncbi:hypothetical protein WN943_011452 [Citrus x changshan-huyou]